MRSAECGMRNGSSDYLSSRKSLDPFRIPHSALRIRMTPGLLIFAATYVLIAAQRLPFLRLNRPAASLLGAVAMVVLGVTAVAGCLRRDRLRRAGVPARAHAHRRLSRGGEV